MDIEQAIKEIKGKDMFSSRTTENGYAYMKGINEAIDTVLNELEKKDKVIDEMIEDLYGLAISINEEYRVEEYLLKKETIKEYYYKKAQK